MIESLENKLLELYLSNIDIICEGFPDSVNARRREAVENFVLAGLPQRKDESYRHSPVRGLFEREWEHYFMPSFSGSATAGMEIEGYNMALNNGFVESASLWNELECGAVIGSLKVATEQMSDVVCGALYSQSMGENKPLAALNNAFMQDGAFIYVPEGVKVQLPIILSYNYSSEQEAQMCFARTLIVAEAGAEVEIIVHHKSQTEDAFFVNYVRECVVGEGADVRFTELSELNGVSSLVANCYMSQGERSAVSAVNVWLGGELTRYSNSVAMDGKESNNKLYALYAAVGEQRFDIQNVVNHNVELCRSFQQVKGVASDSAVGAFTGRVYVAPNAQKTEAIQQSRNLLLSESARIYTEPQLEIYADDVKCGHGATVGQLDSDSIYYMRQRGISEADARRLQMQGFVNDVVMHCGSTEAVDYIRAVADKVLGCI